jgi:hypothetical protein
MRHVDPTKLSAAVNLDDVERRKFTSSKLDWLNSIVADQRLTHFQVRVGLALSFYFNLETSSCFVKQKKLAARASGKRRATQMAIDALIRAGYLAVDFKAGPSDTNVYHLLSPSAVQQDEEACVPTDATLDEVEAPPCAPPCATLAHADAPPMRTAMRNKNTCALTPVQRTPVQESISDRPNEIETRPEDQTDSDSRGATVPMIDTKDARTIDIFRPAVEIIEPTEIQSPGSFEQWWELYPRKVARTGAAKAYERIIKSKQATPSQLLAGVTRYAQERKGQDPKYTKHATTWLSQGCWEDETVIPAAQKARSFMAGLAGYLEGGAR